MPTTVNELANLLIYFGFNTDGVTPNNIITIIVDGVNYPVTFTFPVNTSFTTMQNVVDIINNDPVVGPLITASIEMAATAPVLRLRGKSVATGVVAFINDSSFIANWGPLNTEQDITNANTDFVHASTPSTPTLILEPKPAVPAVDKVYIPHSTTLHVQETAEVGELILNGSVLTPTSLVGNAFDRQGAFRVSADGVYYCSAEYDGSTEIWKKLPFTYKAPVIGVISELYAAIYSLNTHGISYESALQDDSYIYFSGAAQTWPAGHTITITNATPTLYGTFIQVVPPSGAYLQTGVSPYIRTGESITLQRSPSTHEMWVLVNRTNPTRTINAVASDNILVDARRSYRYKIYADMGYTVPAPELYGPTDGEEFTICVYNTTTANVVSWSPDYRWANGVAPGELYANCMHIVTFTFAVGVWVGTRVTQNVPIW